MIAFIALLRKETSNDYKVDFLDFPGCVTAGQTLEEARKAAYEALSLHIEGMLGDGDPIPNLASLDSIMEDTDNQEVIAFLIDIPLSVERVRRINLTFSEVINKSIDNVINNRSRFLAQAAREKLSL
ncbi:MAG: type II toxin-antitoxin system HicB family antitoxin [Commensalibacter sp.]